MCKFNSDDLLYVIDESPERYDRYIGGTNIPIKNKEYLDSNKPDYFLILAWNYTDTIIEKLKDQNYKYIIPFPTIKLL